MIHSDMASMYVNLHTNQSHITQIPVQPPYTHLWVNHSEHFKDPDTQVRSVKKLSKSFQTY